MEYSMCLMLKVKSIVECAKLIQMIQKKSKPEKTTIKPGFKLRTKVRNLAAVPGNLYAA